MSEQEIKFFHHNVILKKGEKMPNLLDYIPPDPQFKPGDTVEVDLETLRLSDLQLWESYPYGKWNEYLEQKGLGLQLKNSDCFMFDCFRVTESKQTISKEK